MSGTPERRTVQANGIDYSYMEYGDPGAPPVILMHGIWSTGAVWHDVATTLAPEFRVLTIDWRGRSHTGWAPDGDYSTDAYVADLRGLYDAWGLERATLVGHSMGGNNAIYFTGAHAEMVQSLVVVDMGPEMGRGRSVGEFERQMAALGQEFPSWAAARAWQRTALPNISDAAVERRLEARLTERDGRVVWREDPAIRGHRDRSAPPDNEARWAAFRAVPCRTLFILGANSPLVTAEVERQLVDTLPDAGAVRIPDAGHNVFEDSPEPFNAALLEFLRANTG